MTIFVRIEPDSRLAGKFHLTAASKLPEGEGHIDITGDSIEAVENKLASQLHTDEEIITLGAIPTLDILK